MNNPPAKWKFALAALPPLLILLALPLKPLLISALGTEVTLAVRCPWRCFSRKGAAHPSRPPNAAANGT